MRARLRDTPALRWRNVTVETSFALVILYAVALVQASRSTIATTGQILGPAQLAAGMLCAALVPGLAVYMLHFHTSWTIGLDPASNLAGGLAAHGFWISLVAALALFLAAAAAYYLSARLTLSGRRLAGLSPALVALGLIGVLLLRGGVGGRFTGEEPPPALIATVVVAVLLVASLIAVGRLDVER